MKFLKYLALGLGGLVALLLLVGLALPGTFKVQRSFEIQAPPDKVYALVVNPKFWKQWSVWHKRDPAMVITYSGPESGAGAVWEWKSATEGDGRMTFVTVEPGQRVVYELYFPDFGTTSTGELRFDPTGYGTKVTWSMSGSMGRNPLFKWFALFADGMVGKDFDAGLSGLKAVAEKS